MNEKVNLQDLVSLLAQKANLSKKEAEIFLKEYFAVITDGLLEDGFVKIKNLGNFKLTQVSERESIDVNQGTRVLIPAHYKVGYTPEAQFAQDINDPFSWLESVDLDQETDLENEDNQAKTESEPLPIIINTETKQQSEVQKPIVPEIEQAKTVDSEIVLEKKEIIIKEDRKGNEGNDDDYESLIKTIFWERYEKAEQPHNHRKKNKRVFLNWISIFLLIIILLGAYLYWKRDIYFPSQKTFISSIDDDFWNEYYTKKKDNDIVSLSDTVITKKNDSLFEEDVNIAKEIIVLTDTVKKMQIDPPVLNNENNNLPNTPIDNQKNRQEEINLSQGKGKTKIISSGDRLTSIALEEYGHKAFWVYIYEENKNRINDPNNLQVGTEIIIPPMSKYKINKNDMESLQRANNLADKYQN